MATDRFGHPHAANLPYARGKILATTEDDFRKLQRAWAIIRERGPDAVFVFTGLEHSLPMSRVCPSDRRLLDPPRELVTRAAVDRRTAGGGGSEPKVIK